MSNSIKRIYHPHWLWEEVKYNMWGLADDRQAMLDWAVDFTGDAERYGEWMMKVAREWTHSCEHNLSNKTQNRKAWIGHAACAYANRCPEDIVRQAWAMLAEDQQEAANNKAQKAIDFWESIHG